MSNVIPFKPAKSTAAPKPAPHYTAEYLRQPLRTLETALGAYIAATREGEPERIVRAHRLARTFACNPFALSVATWEAQNPGRSIFASN